MEWKQILLLSFDELTDLKRDEIYEQLIELRRESLDKKHFKKLIDLQQHILKYKGDMVNTLLTELEGISSKDMPHINTEVLLTENGQLKDIIAKLDADKTKLKARLTELTEENTFLQRRTTHDGSTPGGATSSDREDSPDALSELDKHEELLANISQKNKHIKRLLRDIDSLESKVSSQFDQIAQLRDSLQDATGNLDVMGGQLDEHKRLLAEQTTTIECLRLNVRNMEDQSAVLEREREEREHEISEFGARLEERAVRWRDMLQEKDDRLDSLRTKYEHVLERDPSYNIDAERLDMQRMNDAINVRDEVIADLEAKVTELSREMIDTTDIMNRLAKERETSASGGESARRLKCTSCEETLGRLEKALSRCSELQDLIGTAEEDSALKSKQAMDAIEALNAFQSGQDGLVHAMRKNADLQTQVQARDKHVRSLIAEVNVMQEVAQENAVLRKRLGIPDDELVSTKSFVAKQKKIEKLNERLALKLRASEEMRLQLKLDKNDLKRELAQIHDGNDISTAEPVAFRHCEQCLKQYNTSHVKCDACRHRKDLNICQKCSQSSVKDRVVTPEKIIAPVSDVDVELSKLAENYAIVIEENENLRIGMHEILHQLRNYDAESDHIVIDTPTLEKLLHALDARSVSGWYHPAMRMQNELIAVKEREIALKERVRLQDVCSKEIPPVTVTNPSTTLQTNDTENAQISSKDSCSQESVITSFDNLMQRLIDQETELAASQTALEAALQHQRDTVIVCDHLKDIESQYHDLTEMLANAEDEQVAAISRQSEELVALRSRLNAAERRRQYAEEDFGLWRTRHRAMFERQTCLLFEVRKQLISARKSNIKQRVVETSNHNQDKSKTLTHELSFLKLKLSKFSANALHDFAKLDADQQLPIDFEKINRLGMIQNGCAVNFITKSEIDNLQNENKWLTDRTKELTETNSHLKDLLQMSQDQLQSQQKLLNNQSEDEISLRHMIVDLQSDSQEKYIIAKIGRDLQQARGNELELKAANERLTAETVRLQDRLNEEAERVQRIEQERQDKENDCELKLKFLSKSHADLRDNFQQFTPLYPLVEFIQHYSMVLDSKKNLEKSLKQNQIGANEEMVKQMCDAVRKSIEKGGHIMEDKIDIIKQQTQNAYLKQQLDLANQQIEELHNELKTIKLRAADWSQQWDTIRMLFGPTESPTTTEIEHTSADIDTTAVQVLHKETQSLVKTSDRSVNTETEFVKADADQDSSDSSDHATFTVEGSLSLESLVAPPQPAPRHIKPSVPAVVESPLPPNTSDISLASQLKQAMALASARSALLLDAEHQLTTAQARIKALERSLQERDKCVRELRDNAAKTSSPRRDDNILSVTIASLQGLLQEKDATMARYQDLLRGERENRTAAYEEHRKEVREIQQQIDELTGIVRTKDRELEALKSQKTVENNARCEPNKTMTPSANQRRVSFDSSAGQPMPDAHIEDLFLEEYRQDQDNDTSTDTRRRMQELEDETRNLHAKLREVSKRESGWERTLCEKDKQIAALNDRIGQDKMNFEEITSSITARRDIDQLREMLDEKDRHIGDLTETLTHFHDDQQKFMNDTSIHSAEQVSQLSADLSRSDATNRILSTQLDAMKRQLTAIAQRESQAREVLKTLKTQLIRRPVISVKTASTDRPPSTREEQLQKRMHLQDQELMQTKEELRLLTTAAQSRRNKDSAELALWNKQKRSQQLAETLRQKLIEREMELDKVKGHLASAKTAIARLEREKHILETRRATAGSSGQKVCQSPSCPNIHVSTSTKYTAAESPDSYAVMMNYAEQQPPLSAESQPGSSRSRQTGVMLDISDGNQEVIDALRARIEAQQRRIVAMELEGRGGSAMGGELERIQEKVSNVEAMNIRLEARNLHLQLENDMLRQGDQGEKTRRQIKHLEDYIIALKSELTQIQINAADAHKQHTVGNTSGTLSQQQHMEQTILSMRRVVERLKFENKQLKDGKTVASTAISSSTGGKGQGTVVKEIYEKMRTDLEQVQQSYSEALDKISSLQIELDIQRRTCSACKSMMEAVGQGDSHIVEDIASLKDKLIKKTQLLEKAKILLSRAATKEKHFREQMIFWKRRCAELQNVPVIEETSE